MKMDSVVTKLNKIAERIFDLDNEKPFRDTVGRWQLSIFVNC